MAKMACEKLDVIPITELKRQGLLESNKQAWITHESGFGVSETRLWTDFSTYPPRVWISHGDTQPYAIELTRTPCYFGGFRYWFVCPLTIQGKKCERRVGTLYLGGEWFGCRSCYQLSYLSRQRSPKGDRGLLLAAIRLESSQRKDMRCARTSYWRGRRTKRHSRLLQREKRLLRITKELALS